MHVQQGERVTEDRVALTPTLLAEDALIFGLRMNAGVDVGLWRRRCPDAPWGAVEGVLGQMVDDGLARRTDSHVQLTDRGRLLADSVGTEIMTAFSTETVSA
jgi:oxygen-independent coproporphyrinogen-3 oxidase